MAFGAIIFMHNFMQESAGIQTEPLHIALWGIPTAVAAFLIHSARLVRLDRQLARELHQLNVELMQLTRQLTIQTYQTRGMNQECGNGGRNAP